MEAEEQFRVVKSHFRNFAIDYPIVGKEGISRGMRIGIYIPAQVERLYFTLHFLINEGMVDPSKPFLDAGSGDGRANLVASLCGFPSFGIEYEGWLIEVFRKHSDNLQHLPFLQQNPPIVVEGNFTRDEPYNSMGIPFSQFGTIYNFFNNYHDIIKKIQEESPPGTVFLLYRPPPIGQYEGLSLEGILDFKDLEITNKPHLIKPDLSDEHPLRAKDKYLAVYKKQNLESISKAA